MWHKIHSEIVKNTSLQCNYLIFSSEENLRSDDKKFVSMIIEMITNIEEQIREVKTYCYPKLNTKIKNPYSDMFSEETCNKTMTL